MTTLAELTTLRVGGPAGRLLEPASREELVEAVRGVWEAGDDWLLLGGGSNLVVSDDGFEGTVVRVVTRGVERLDAAAPAAPGVHGEGAPPRTVRLRVEAGEPWDDVVAFAVEHGWSGIEALSGIPGSAGAAPLQNIGAYGQELSSSLVAIDFLDAVTGEVTCVAAPELGLGYRTSTLKRGRQGLVAAIELALVDDPVGRPIAYAQLADALGVRIGDRVPVSEVRRAVIGLRAAKGMIWDPGDPDSVSAGSFFTNPVVGEGFARGLPAAAPRWPTASEEPDRILPLGADVPPPAAGEYLVKLSAAWLIEHAGIPRGFALPGSRAAISGKHSLAIVNRGAASAEQVAELARFVQTRVLAEFGVLLQPEPVLIGIQL